MTNRRTHPRHRSQPLYRRAVPAPLLATSAALAIATTGLVAYRLADDAPTPKPGANAVAFVDRPDRGQADTADAQAFADHVAAAFADYLEHPDRTGPLLHAGVDRDELAPTTTTATRQRAPVPRAPTARSRTMPAGDFMASRVNARRTRAGWLLSASISTGQGPDRVVVPLVATARPTADGFRVTSLNARSGAE